LFYINVVERRRRRVVLSHGHGKGGSIFWRGFIPYVNLDISGSNNDSIDF
jgi:hypothetical protein